jgi:hypothetical protein
VKDEVQRVKLDKRRHVTDAQIRLLRSWIPFHELARAIGISPNYATRLRNGRIFHKTPSP